MKIKEIRVGGISLDEFLNFCFFDRGFELIKKEERRLVEYTPFDIAENHFRAVFEMKEELLVLSIETCRKMVGASYLTHGTNSLRDEMLTGLRKHLFWQHFPTSSWNFGTSYYQVVGFLPKMRDENIGDYGDTNLRRLGLSVFETAREVLLKGHDFFIL